MRKVLMVLFLALAGAFPAYAQVWGGGSLSIGIREDSKRAGLSNFSGEFYYTEDGKLPGRDAEPFSFLSGSGKRPAFANHIPGYPGKYWFLMKSLIVNSGEIENVELSFVNKDERVLVPAKLTDSQAEFWIDLSQFKAGSYPMKLKVKHLGGEVTYHVLFFLFRSEKSVTDETCETLNVYNPERQGSMAEVEFSHFQLGAEPSNGGKAFKLNTKKDLPVLLAPPKPISATNTGQSGSYGGFAPPQPGTVMIDVFGDRMRVTRASGRFDLQDEQGQVFAGQTGGQLTFTVPPGRYRLIGYGDWTICGHQATIFVASGENQTINVFRKGGRK